MVRNLTLMALLLTSVFVSAAQPEHAAAWRAATEAELKSLLPARAPVQQERIETEMRTASGITDGHGKFVAGIVLITAGYSADGKYSHFFLTQVPLRIGSFSLTPGAYVIGWEHDGNGLHVNFYKAASSRPLGSVDAILNPAMTRVESFRIWPPAERSPGRSPERLIVQIGRFTFPCQIGDTLP